MKRIIGVLLCLVLLLGLCACGGEEGEKERSEASGAVLPDSVDPETGAWKGQGGCYRTEPFDTPDYAAVLRFRQGEMYYIGWKSPGDCRLYRGDRELVKTGGHFLDFCMAAEGLWLLEEEREDQRFFARLRLYSYEGEPLRDLRVELPADGHLQDLGIGEGVLYLNCSSCVLACDAEGALLAAIPHAEWEGRLLLGGDGAVYFLDQRENGGGTVSSIDPDGACLKELFRYEKGFVSGGDGESPFLLLLQDGLYRLEKDGSSRPLALWDECGLSVSGVTTVEAVGDGSYLLGSMMSVPMLLRPAEPAEIRPKTVLTICVIPSQAEIDMGMDLTWSYGSLIPRTTAFNAWSTDCTVKIVDLTDGGSLTAEQALSRLNTQLISGGEAPDMLLLSGAISPFPLIRHGLLRDLAQDVEADPEMSLDDIQIAEAVIRDCGGLYLLSDSFSFMPRIGLQSRFGQVWGWSFDQYLRLARETPEDKMVMYNLTRDYFVDSCLSRYLRQGIDWKAGTCDFDNPAFIAILEACRDMKETPEDPNNLVFGDNLMAQGFIVTDLTMLMEVTDLAKAQRHVGQPICVIGWPTVDGSCGEDYGVGQPIGVLNSTAHPELCWEFLRYCLLHPDSGIPVYRPLIDKQLQEAREIDPNQDFSEWDEGLRSPMTEEEIAFFREFLAHVEHTDLLDETAMSIAREETQAFLAGQITAEEAASRIQKRMSIYVAEQG